MEGNFSIKSLKEQLNIHKYYEGQEVSITTLINTPLYFIDCHQVHVKKYNADRMIVVVTKVKSNIDKENVFKFFTGSDKLKKIFMSMSSDKNAYMYGFKLLQIDNKNIFEVVDL